MPKTRATLLTKLRSLFVWSPPRYAGGAKKLTALPMSVTLLFYTFLGVQIASLTPDLDPLSKIFPVWSKIPPLPLSLVALS